MTSPVDFTDDATALYRLFDADGALPYVGIASSPRHPGLTFDPERAARFDAVVTELDGSGGEFRFFTPHTGVADDSLSAGSRVSPAS